MASKREETLKLLKKVLPDDSSALQIIYLDEIAGRLAELQQSFKDYQKLTGPTAWLFPRNRQYQWKTVPYGKSDVVYRLEVPSPNVVGIISQVANSWFHDTYLEWEIDRDVKKVEYIIGQIDAPKEYVKGIPFYERVVWTAYNNDATPTVDYDPDEGHTFQVVCDGYFMEKKLFKRLAGVQGEPLR